MLAIRIHGFGRIDNLRLDAIPRPAPGAESASRREGAGAGNRHWRFLPSLAPGCGI